MHRILGCLLAQGVGTHTLLGWAFHVARVALDFYLDLMPERSAKALFEQCEHRGNRKVCMRGLQRESYDFPVDRDQRGLTRELADRSAQLCPFDQVGPSARRVCAG